MSGLKKYLEIKEILNEDDELRKEFESLWEGFLIGFYNFNKEDFNTLIEDFVSFYEFLVRLSLFIQKIQNGLKNGMEIKQKSYRKERS